MNGDYKELVEYLDEKFGKVDVDMKELKADFDLLQKSVDAYAVRADKYFQEMVMLSHKVDRHDKWIHIMAEKLGIKLDY